MQEPHKKKSAQRLKLTISQEEILKINQFQALTVLSIFLASCSYGPLGDGTLKGRLPRNWNDSKRLDPASILRITNDNVPIPYEMNFVISPCESAEPEHDQWAIIRETKIPGPTVRVGDQWNQTERHVRVYHRRYIQGQILEATVDTRFNQKEVENFLAGLSFAVAK